MITAFALAALAASSSAVVTSTFDTNAEGWHTVSYPDTIYNVTPVDFGISTYNATGGNPGGYISQNDPDGGDTFFAAPAKFLGNALSAYGTNPTYDLADTGNSYNSASTVVLKGGGLVAAYNSASLPAPTFTPFSIPLTETGWVTDTFTGTAISQADFKTILTHLTSLEIRSEYVVGGEVGSLDNVRLQVVSQPTPEPAPLAALGVGLVAFVRRRKRA